MELTEKWLNNAAGWQVLKEARTVWKGGGVLEASYEGKLLKGVVTRAGKRQVAGFVINSRSDLDNLCKCPTARRYGQVCAHSVAVALQVINGEPSPLQKPETVSKTASLPKKESKPRGVGLLPIFDQRLVSMWERGRIPVKLEIGPIEPPGAWDWLESVGVTTLPVHAVLNPEQASQFLTLTAESPAKLGEEDFLISGTSAARLKVELRQKDDEFEVIPSKWMSQDQVRLKDWVFIPKFRAIQPLRKPPKGGEKAYENLLQGKTVRLSAGELLANVDGWHDCLEFRSEVGQGLVVRPGNPSFQLKVEGSMNALSGVATVIYADNLNFRLGKSPQSNAFPFRSEDGAFVVRNALGEHQAQQALTEDLGFSGPDKDGQFQMRGEADISRFYASSVAKLGKKWEVELGERFQHVTRNLEVIRPRFVSQGTENNWLSFAIDYSSPAGSEIPREEIQKLLNKSQNRVQLANGRSAVVDLEACAEADEVIYDVQANQEGGGQFRVQSSQSGYLTAALGAEDLTDTTAVNLDELGELNEVLRDYQRDGIEWILQRFRGGAKACLLADEMGLGKTLQSFAALQMLKNSEEGQVLIVCPTSLLSNWQLEAAKFIPLLKTEILHGPKRWDNPKKLEGTDILITSYALLVRDAEKYAERPFLLTVLDEASAIKNPDTKNAKACRAIDSKHRIALTGTPVENTVRELWSIFQYLIPGYLGSRDEFKERYESPIAGGAASKQVLERLRNRIKPLTLRRLKQTVAKDLPPKIEQVRFCQLSPAQAQLYEAILRESRKKIDDALSQKSEGQARMTMLTALLRLRQVCCEPRLLALDEETKATSAKLELFSELVTEAIEGEHKMLVFSQFTAMLKILREQLEDKDIPYNYLDGSSTDRTEQVQQFQKSRERQVFLISLKAGGYGLNLTAADTVIHYDPWWNPAVEAQATDRAHRIGQTNPVSAYKLITTGTVEERILALQRRKKAVIDAALDDGEPLMRGLATEEIREVIG